MGTITGSPGGRQLIGATRATRRARARAALAAVAVLLAALLVSAVGPSPASATAASLTGTVESGGTPLDGYHVTLYRTDPSAAPEVVGTDVTDASGAFTIPYDTGADPSRTFYVLARSSTTTVMPDSVTLGAVLGPIPGSSTTVNPRTTVATAYAMAQFLQNGVISGSALGITNAASMSRNVADPVTGAIGDVLDTSPNGSDTSARATFNSLANLVAACVASHVDCDAIRAAATPVGGTEPADVLQALRDMVVDPSHDVLALYTLSQAGPTPYSPARTDPPDAWTLALRFDGPPNVPKTMNGPGNFVMDHEGDMWVSNNYTYAPPGEVACASNLVMRFTPDGRYHPGSPYAGGGLSGVGFGIARDRYGDIWLSNFGFGAVECPDQPPHDSLSQFSADGVVLSPDEGYVSGGLDWPQGMAFDSKGTLWVANCENDSVTVLPGGDPAAARNISGIGVKKPFDVAFGSDGNTYVTGTESNNVVALDPSGQVQKSYTGFNRPMGIASDAEGALWVASSGIVDLPCPTKDVQAVPPPSLGYIDPATGQAAAYSGGGLAIPWGVSVDGHGNVWVSNFGGERLSEFCGRDASPYCPAGKGKGDPISPDVTGFSFDGLYRATAAQADSAGNVWVTNNFKQLPPEINPGGYQVVVFLGLAGPVTPPPAPEPKPSPTPTTAPAAKVVVAPRFTG